MSLTNFKPTPFALSETELDDLIHGLRHRITEAEKTDDYGQILGLETAIVMIENARSESFDRRSKARVAKRRKLAAA